MDNHHDYQSFTTWVQHHEPTGYLRDYLTSLDLMDELEILAEPIRLRGSPREAHRDHLARVVPGKPQKAS